jgi:hypothetical protein
LNLAAYAGLASVHLRTGTLTHGSIWATLGWYAAAYAAYLAALCWAEVRRTFCLPLVFIGAAIFSALLWITPPTLSSDVFRYLWDGHVANHGVSPYAYPIDAPELDTLAVPVRDQADHTWMASPYLPVAQWLFAATTRLLPLEPLSMQIVMSICNLAAGGVLVLLLGMAGLPRRRVLIYLWNPLVVVETAHGAHVDAWMVLLTLAAVAAAFYPAEGDGQGRTARFVARYGASWLSPILLGLATLTKGLPGLVAPVLVWRWRWRQGSWGWGALLYGLTVVALAVPAGLRAGWGLVGPLDGRGLFGALRIYGDRWNYNSGLFHWLEIELVDSGGLALTAANRLAKQANVILLVILLLAVWLAARKATTRRALRLMAVPWMGYLLLTPTAHPWYLLPLLTFAPFLAPGDEEPRLGWLLPAPWLYLAGAVSLSYLTYLDPLNLRELEWVRRLEWLPTLGLMLVGVVWLLVHWWHNRRAPAQP